MTKYQFSKQDVIRLLSQLGKIRMDYPPDLLATRRRLYLSLAAQTAVSRIVFIPKRQQLVASILNEPGSAVIKALIVIIVAFLVAYVAYSMANGNIDLGWFLGLLSH